MNSLESLQGLDPRDKTRLGIEHTVKEILQQPDVWAQTASMLRHRRDEVRQFLFSAGLMGPRSSICVTTGAGSSEFVGSSVTGLLRTRLAREFISIPTTHLVTHLRASLVDRSGYTLISFARSGNSPESLATVEKMRRVRPDAMHIVITCNREGALARTAKEDPRALCLVLPEETNDRSLVMTSSFSTMALAALGLGYVDQPDEFETIVDSLASAVRAIFRDAADALKTFAEKSFVRACFLGSGALYATMQECQLKLQEMTEGRIASRHESFLGLRHGPQVFVNDGCVVVAALASDPDVRRYELDMLRELREKKQGAATLVICDRADDEIKRVGDVFVELFPKSGAVPDNFRILTDVVVGQLLGTFKSLHVGLKPDNPSSTGVINRVVKGVVIYED